MKRKLLAVGMLTASLTASAQLMNVNGGDSSSFTSLFYISDGTLVYSGGGVQTKGNGTIDNHGNMMIVGTGSDVISTREVNVNANTLGALRTTGGNIILRLNNPADPTTSTYGQLYVDGIAQSNITGVVNKEYKDLLHGSFQQMSIPFADKTVASFATNVGKTGNFSSGRNTQALAYWDNIKTVMRIAPNSVSTDGGSLTSLYGPTTYFAVGTTGWTPNVATALNLVGKPFSNLNGMTVSLTNGGKPGGVAINYGVSGENQNEFTERYRTYLNDPFDTRWVATYGKELYQYGNPFFTNIDLSKIMFTESAAIGDGIKLPVQGIRYSQSGVVYNSTTGTSTSDNRYVTFSYTDGNTANVTPVGDVNNLVVKPLGAIYIKLNPKLETDFPAAGFNRSLDFTKLRRFSSTARNSATSYSVTAAKSANIVNTVKQLGVIALDASGKELTRSYYVVSNNFTTGYTTNYNVQANTGFESNNTPVQPAIFTSEEFPSGGVDPTYVSQYGLYINEANESNFIHKEIPLSIRGATSKIKFEIRENADLIADNQSLLSAGEGFWIRINGVNTLLSQNSEVSISSGEFGLYYGEPQVQGSLAVSDVKASTTVVAFDKDQSEFYAIFDKNWKKADISIYDLSGKLISNLKNISAGSKYLLPIPKNTGNAFLVVIKADNGQVYNTKIMR